MNPSVHVCYSCQFVRNLVPTIPLTSLIESILIYVDFLHEDVHVFWVVLFGLSDGYGPC